MYSRAFFCRNRVFVTLAPLCSDSSTFEGLGAQVGATWAQKSCPRGVRTAKMTSNRAAGGVRTFIFRSFGRLYSKSCYFLKCIKHIRKNTFSRVREGPGAQVGATWAQKSRPRVVRTAKTTSNKVAGGVRAVKVRPVRLDCPSESWNTQVISTTRTGSEVKVYLYGQSYD